MRSEMTEVCMCGWISGNERVQRVVCRILTSSLCSKLFELCVHLFLYPVLHQTRSIRCCVPAPTLTSTQSVLFNA